MSWDIARQLSSIVFVLGLAVFAATRFSGGGQAIGQRLTWKTGWRPSARQHKELAVLDSMHLTPTHTLHRVRMLEHEFLLVTHSHGVTLISEEDVFQGTSRPNREAAKGTTA